MDNFINIMNKDILAQNVNFAAVFVMNFECLKELVIERLREFYAEGFFTDGCELKCEESEKYKQEVRELDRKNLDNASLKWFIEAGVISSEDYELYQVIRKRRNDITHELLKNLGRGFDERDVKLFSEMVRIYNQIDKWWINEIEIPISGQENSDDYNRDDVYGGQALILSMINEILFGDGADTYKRLLHELVENLE